uniref:ATP-binding protein n=1 Tax=Candidatus Electronema sp. TaxID=2698783 RepID=UPI0040562631
MLANYKEERAAFARLWERQCRERILLLRGQSGCGKTSLLKHCRQSAQPEKVFLIFVDCKRDGINPAEVFSLAADHAGRNRLPAFSQCLRQHNVEIRDNQIEGNSNQISVVLGGGSEQERKERLVWLTNAWLEDISQFDRPLLLVVDTYEKAGADLQSWLRSLLVRLPRACKPLRIVLAGQEVPDTNTGEEWADCCCERELNGVPEPEHWLPVVEGLGLQIPQLFLAGICHAMQGNPAEILKAIQRPF